MNSDPRDYKLDISSLNPSPEDPSAQPTARPYLSVLFECCNVYQRVYRNPADPAYIARCPRCARTATFPVGEAGTATRTFRVR
jgi:hypothetical protein